mgnify:CR=1 FL=1
MTVSESRDNDIQIALSDKAPRQIVSSDVSFGKKPHVWIAILADEGIWHAREIRPEDAEMEQDFIRDLSDEARYFRFMQVMQELTPEMLVRFTQIDYDREMALVAVVNEHTPRARILGVARYVSNPDRQSCEFALTVADEWQKKGIGRQLMQRLMTVARDRGIEIMEGEVLSNNSKMLRLCERLGFRAVHSAADPDVVAVRRHL